MDLLVRALPEQEWQDWDRWLALQPWGSPFSTAWWLDTSCRQLGGTPLVLGIFDGSKLAGGLSLRVKAAGPVHLARPFLLYNPILLADGSPRRQQLLLGSLLDELVRRRLILPSLTCTPDLLDLRTAVWKGWHLTPEWTVTNQLGDWSLEKSCERSLRADVRRARESGVTVRAESPDAQLLNRLMNASVERHGEANSTHAGLLKAYLEAAGQRTLFIVARQPDGTPVSVVCYMWSGAGTAFALWGGSSRAGLAQEASSLAYVTGLGLLQEQGFAHIDWCGGNLPGVSDHKLEYGGELVPRFSLSREPAWFRAVFAGYRGVRRLVVGLALRGRRAVPQETGQHMPAGGQEDG